MSSEDCQCEVCELATELAEERMLRQETLTRVAALERERAEARKEAGEWIERAGFDAARAAALDARAARLEEALRDAVAYQDELRDKWGDQLNMTGKALLEIRVLQQRVAELLQSSGATSAADDTARSLQSLKEAPGGELAS